MPQTQPALADVLRAFLPEALWGASQALGVPQVPAQAPLAAALTTEGPPVEWTQAVMPLGPMGSIGALGMKVPASGMMEQAPTPATWSHPWVKLRTTEPMEGERVKEAARLLDWSATQVALRLNKLTTEQRLGAEGANLVRQIENFRQRAQALRSTLGGSPMKKFLPVARN